MRLRTAAAFLVFAFGLHAVPRIAADSLLLLSRAEARAIKDAIARNDARVAAAAARLRREAEARTKSLGYSAMNLNGFSML